METNTLFDIEALKRDWIEGISGEAFYTQVQVARELIERLPVADQGRGVLIAETNPIEFAVALFAAVSLRVPVVLANPRWGRIEWDAFQSLVNPALSFGDCAFEPKKLYFDSLQQGSILIPTGGTTGGVKLAKHTWSSLSVAAHAVADFLGGGPINSCCCLPLFHVSGLMQLVRSFVSVGRIRFDDTEVEGYCLSLVPTQLQRLLRDRSDCERLAAARAIFVGGAGMPQAVSDQARGLRLPIIPVYGMTETAAMVAAVPSDDFIGSSSAGAIPIGKARFRVMSDGRLRIYSPALFIGYQGDVAIDPAAGYVTDDEARIGEDGRLHIIGRLDRVIMSGGEKIDPQEVEEAIMSTGAVEQVLVIGLPDLEWGQKLVAFYTTTGVDRDASKWEEGVRADLANYKFPKLMIQVPILPLDDRGKVDHKEVERLVSQNLRLEGS
ncbi:MAG: AMP-binding protein [Opitutaceae bacterium]